MLAISSGYAALAYTLILAQIRIAPEAAPLGCGGAGTDFRSRSKRIPAAGDRNTKLIRDCAFDPSNGPQCDISAERET